MRACLLFFAFLLLFAACEKQGDTFTLDTGTLCADTASLTPLLPEGMQTVYFLNDSTGFIGGNEGGLYKTNDGGAHWASQPSGVSLPIYSVLFLDEQTGFASGGSRGCSGNGCVIENSFILKTTDGGNTWKQVYTPTVKTEVRSLCFLNSTTGFALSGTTVLKTSDAGQTWHEYSLPDLHTTMMEVRFSDLNKGYIACLADIVVTTADGGNTWQVQHPRNNDPVAGYTSLSVTGNVVYVAGQKEIIKSTDGGVSWQVLHPSPADINAIHFVNATTGYALGTGNYSGGDFGYNYTSFYCTHDGGNTWEGTANLKYPGSLIGAVFPNDNTGYALIGNRLMRLSF